MKRKTFILAASTVAVGLPVAYYLKKNKGKITNPISTPGMLSIFCDEKTLRDIGNEYKKLAPQENTKQKLTDLLLSKEGVEKIKPSDARQIMALIDSKVNADFLMKNILIINGWVISVTEARQCALLSLT